jgi:hypothetical protein
VRWPWQHVHKMRMPRNPTVCTKQYDPRLWQAICEECGEREPIPVENVRESGGGLAIYPPEGWR